MPLSNAFVSLVLSSGLSLGLGVAVPVGAPSGNIGAGARLAPIYDGAERYALRPVGAGRVTLGDRATIDLRRDTRLDIRLAEPGAWRLGVTGAHARGRSSGAAPRLAGTADRPWGLDLGAFAERRDGPLTWRASLTRDITGGHGGVIAALEGEAQTGLGPWPWVVGVDGRLRLADRAHMDAYFGVDAGADELAAYSPDGGLRDIAAGVTVARLLGARWAVTARTGGRRLLDDAADSPIAATAWQGDARLSLVYRFRRGDGGP